MWKNIVLFVAFATLIFLGIFNYLQSRRLDSAAGREKELVDGIAAAYAIAEDLGKSMDWKDAELDRDRGIIENLQGNIRRAEENNRKLESANKRLEDFKRRTESAEREGQGIINQIRNGLEEITDFVENIPERTGMEAGGDIP